MHVKTKVKRLLAKVSTKFRSDNSGEIQNLANLEITQADKVWLGRTVVVKVTGGLCNQMMCYKAGRLVAEWNEASLIIFVPNFQLDDHRTFFLNRYPIRFSMLTYSKQLISAILKSNEVFKVTREHLFESDGSRVEGEQKEQIFMRIRSAKVVYIDFYLALYFWRGDNEYVPDSQTLNDLVLNAQVHLTSRDKEVKREIETCLNSVAIHVRRTDFLSPEYDLEVRADYYNNAIEFISQRVESPQFYVFSDDIDWCRKKLRAEGPLMFVDHNDARACTSDLYLGSLCRHLILTNHSTFSHHMAELRQSDREGLVITNSKEYVLTKSDISEYYTPKHCTVI